MSMRIRHHPVHALRKELGLVRTLPQEASIAFFDEGVACRLPMPAGV